MRLPQTLRMTRQRRVILEELKRATSHPTADKVYRAARRTLPRISLATVYRNLEILSGRGLIARLEATDGRRRYDGNVQEHYHVRCIRCGRVGHVHIKPVALKKHTLSRGSDYEITGHRLEFVGICPRCQRKTAATGRARGKGDKA